MRRLIRLTLQPVEDEPDQVIRLRCFRADHPGVSIYTGTCYWQARISLRELLGKFHTILSAQDATYRPTPAEETTT